MLLFKYVQTAEKMKKDKAANAQKFLLKNRRGGILKGVLPLRRTKGGSKGENIASFPP